MALNRSPEFKSSNLKPSATELLVYYAILYTGFKASEPSCSETEDVFHIAYVFLCFKPRSPWGKAILDP